MNTIGDLQGGLEEAERLLGYTVTRAGRAGRIVDTGPALVSILRQGSYLIASIHTALDDSQMVRFQRDLIDQIGSTGRDGVIIDVAASTCWTRSARAPCATSPRWLGSAGRSTVIVGIQPDVAFAMVRLGMGTGSVAHGTGSRGGPGVPRSPPTPAHRGDPPE